MKWCQKSSKHGLFHILILNQFLFSIFLDLSPQEQKQSSLYGTSVCDFVAENLCYKPMRVVRLLSEYCHHLLSLQVSISVPFICNICSTHFAAVYPFRLV